MSEWWCRIRQYTGPSDNKARIVWSVVKEKCFYGCAASKKNNHSLVWTLPPPAATPVTNGEVDLKNWGEWSIHPFETNFGALKDS